MMTINKRRVLRATLGASISGSAEVNDSINESIVTLPNEELGEDLVLKSDSVSNSKLNTPSNSTQSTFSQEPSETSFDPETSTRPGGDQELKEREVLKADCEFSAKHDSEKQRMQGAYLKKLVEIKGRTWCANCLREAQMYCCWNTAYCSTECQNEAWPFHKSCCRRERRVEKTDSSKSSENSKSSETSKTTTCIEVTERNEKIENEKTENEKSEKSEKTTNEEIEKQKKRTEVDFQKQIDDIKRKQWCANCLKEATTSCCWNTAYCDDDCRRQHWPAHKNQCRQIHSQTVASDKNEAVSSPSVVKISETNEEKAKTPREDAIDRILETRSRIFVKQFAEMNRKAELERIAREGLNKEEKKIAEMLKIDVNSVNGGGADLKAVSARNLKFKTFPNTVLNTVPNSIPSTVPNIKSGFKFNFQPVPINLGFKTLPNTVFNTASNINASPSILSLNFKPFSNTIEPIAIRKEETATAEELELAAKHIQREIDGCKSQMDYGFSRKTQLEKLIRALDGSDAATAEYIKEHKRSIEWHVTSRKQNESRIAKLEKLKLKERCEVINLKRNQEDNVSQSSTETGQKAKEVDLNTDLRQVDAKSFALELIKKQIVMTESEKVRVDESLAKIEKVKAELKGFDEGVDFLDQRKDYYESQRKIIETSMAIYVKMKRKLRGEEVEEELNSDSKIENPDRMPTDAEFEKMAEEQWKREGKLRNDEILKRRAENVKREWLEENKGSQKSEINSQSNNESDLEEKSKTISKSNSSNYAAEFIQSEIQFFENKKQKLAEEEAQLEKLERDLELNDSATAAYIEKERDYLRSEKKNVERKMAEFEKLKIKDKNEDKKLEIKGMNEDEKRESSAETQLNQQTINKTQLNQQTINKTKTQLNQQTIADQYIEERKEMLKVSVKFVNAETAKIEKLEEELGPLDDRHIQNKKYNLAQDRKYCEQEAVEIEKLERKLKERTVSESNSIELLNETIEIEKAQSNSELASSDQLKSSVNEAKSDGDLKGEFKVESSTPIQIESAPSEYLSTADSFSKTEDFNTQQSAEETPRELEKVVEAKESEEVARESGVEEEETVKEAADVDSAESNGGEWSDLSDADVNAESKPLA